MAAREFEAWEDESIRRYCGQPKWRKNLGKMLKRAEKTIYYRAVKLGVLETKPLDEGWDRETPETKQRDEFAWKVYESVWSRNGVSLDDIVEEIKDDAIAIEKELRHLERGDLVELVDGLWHRTYNREMDVLTTPVAVMKQSRKFKALND